MTRAASSACALQQSGYCPFTTPVDTLMAAPVSVHLAVAEAMEDDGNYPDYDLDGFHEWDPEEEDGPTDTYYTHDGDALV